MKKPFALYTIALISAVTATSAWAGRVDDKTFKVIFNGNPTASDCFVFDSTKTPGTLTSATFGTLVYGYDSNSLTNWQAVGTDPNGIATAIHGTSAQKSQATGVKIEISGFGINANGIRFTLTGQEDPNCVPQNVFFKLTP